MSDYAKVGTIERTDRQDKPVRLHLGDMGYVDMAEDAADNWARRLLKAAHPDTHMFMIPVESDGAA